MWIWADPDDFAHAGDYGDYLDAAHASDAMFRISGAGTERSFHKDQTALLVFPDSWRGFDTQWTDHGSDAPHK